MTNTADIPARIIARLLVNMPCGQRAAALAEIIKHASQGLRIIQGQQAAAEHLYAAADAMACQREAA